MKTLKLLLTFILAFTCGMASAQKNSSANAGKWIIVNDDETVKVSYNSNITKDKSGNHIVWVKAEFKTPDWQRYMAQQIGSRTPVCSTKTKAMYDNIYSYVMVRQVLCFNKAGKQIYNTGDDTSAGWYPVNASDPVGIVGEYLDKQHRY